MTAPTKKSIAAAIRAATPLTKLPTRGADPIRQCGLCGEPVDPADLPATCWREHDERDRPIPGTEAIVFLGTGKAHEACKRRLDDHPRLYAEESGGPGHFPALCGDCTHRRDLSCANPKLLANGGEGLLVAMDRLGAIVCTRGAGCHRPVARAVRCEGRLVR